MTKLNQSKKSKEKDKFLAGPIVLDVVGKTLDKDDVRRIAHPKTGGVILFGRNYQDRKQLTALTKAIKAVRSDVMISIDHEGGRVQRCRTDGFTHLPAMKRLGDIWSNHGKRPDASHAITAMDAATAVGFILASELRACGVDFSFTPVLDLDFGRSAVIGDRSFHRDPQIAYALAKSLNHGLLLAGMANCGKHFPGHGWAEADSHVAIPVDERPLKSILNDDAQPYQWLGLGLASVMPAHVIYSKVDKNPAGFSKIWLQDILRKQMKFTGVIFSDDLSMEGASVAGSVVKGAEMALKAGCDQVLICNRPDLADELLKHLKYDEKAFKTSRARLEKLMPSSRAMAWHDLQESPDYQKAKQQLKQLGLIAA
ncbi:beta-N-acetylhexosaminidase [Polynucleobacter sp. MWH-Spelu-300-X4]|uniref:beta-N-acetylhexosaminidase n=1 Tax=Polynucleobacter sp. MWH-Spelu-300-X4 TaxID=2689109 RepID=UPI001BFD20F5|nr:beta-N-acetylhexosaminidase [Polynucleobacter sp. MWH-Spelu-300-X4]QWD80292.1 beta-N-acetylhexosaminidase [Polynucleobacter sp. MWH-Spelu-300-X4]